MTAQQMMENFYVLVSGCKIGNLEKDMLFRMDQLLKMRKEILLHDNSCGETMMVTLIEKI